MAKQQTDDELNLRRKARRRLIGAVALTLAVVVILPMVLDSEPRITGKDIDLSIPDPDKAGEFVPRVAVSAMPVPAASSAVVEIPAPPVTQTDAAKPVVAPVQSRMATGKAQPAAQKPAETRNADKPAGVESYVAQVGAYSNADTAKQELKKLKKWGFKAYTEKAGDKTRVRVGPYPDRDKAEKVAHLLEKHGLHPVIVSNK
ncbi:MAG TPA: SPOR domain-containing protein [Gallionella sp.]|nr:SPOR domain-containing protein [Gallionella sp.]